MSEIGRIDICIEDYVELGYNGKISFICMCGCNKQITINIVDYIKGYEKTIKALEGGVQL